MKTKNEPKGSIQFLVFAGMILPTAALIIEILTGICELEFLNPIPTVFHILVIALVPLTNLLTLFAIANADSRQNLLTASFFNAFSLGICASYALVFIPMMPLAIFALIFGIGLLPLAPLLALMATALVRKRLNEKLAQSEGSQAPSIAIGLIVAISVLTIIEAPKVVTLLGIQLTRQQVAHHRVVGQKILSATSSTHRLLKACEGRFKTYFGLPGVILGLFSEGVEEEEARQLLFLGTGETYRDAMDDSGGEPIVRTRRDTFFEQERSRPVFTGSPIVGPLEDKLTLTHSRFDGALDSTSGTANIQWTMEFFNNRKWTELEARTLIQLPPGGVVNEATLWVNRKARNAVFAATGKVRRAYREIAVRQRKDPLLVTWKGKDKVFLQCSPILSKSSMKIRISVTCPFINTDKGTYCLSLPHFAGRNFSFAKGLTHKIDVGKRKLFVFASSLHGAIERQNNSSVKAQDATKITLRLQSTKLGEVIEWKRLFNSQRVKNMAIVIDNSFSMKPHLASLKAALKGCIDKSSTVKSKIIVARHEAIYSDVNLSAFTGAGGFDNNAALQAAIDWASSKKKSAIIWLHGAQPLPTKVKGSGATIYGINLTGGVDAISFELHKVGTFEEVPLLATPGETLKRLFLHLSGKAPIHIMKPLPMAALRKSEKKQGMLCLSAKEEVEKLLTSDDPLAYKRAVEIGAKYRIVTRASGAVVLETDQQYKETGLKPNTPGEPDIPGVPESETWLLLLITLCIMTASLIKKSHRGEQWTN